MLVLWPLLVAWQGSGKSQGDVTVTPLDGPAPPQAVPGYTAFDAVARVTPGRTRCVLLFALPGERDAVLTLTLDTDWGSRVALPDPLVHLVYEEFTQDGETQFLTEAATGTVETIFRTSGALSLTAELVFEDERGGRRVAFSGLAVTLVPDVVAPDSADEASRAAPAGGGVAASSGGCEDDGYDGSEASDPAWQSEGSSSDDSGGCDSDDDTSDDLSDADDSSGCEGDDVESDSESSDSCDGDAAAAVPPPPGLARPPRAARAALPAKLVAWAPYLIVLLGLRILRARRRLAAVVKFR